MKEARLESDHHRPSPPNTRLETDHHRPSPLNTRLERLGRGWFKPIIGEVGSVVCNDTKRLFSLQEYIRKVTALETLYLSIFQPLLRTKDLVEMKNNNSL